MYIYIHIHTCGYMHFAHNMYVYTRTNAAAKTISWICIIREFKDVVFEDVAFDNNRFSLILYI